MEMAAAAAPSRRRAPAASRGEAIAMLARRGFRVTPSRLDLPFPRDLEGPAALRLRELLHRYSFRLFLRGVIQKADGFRPETATTYLTPAQARTFTDALVELELVVPVAEGRYRLAHPAHSFGGTLEWWVAEELRELGFDTAAGLRFRAPGVGGDLDVVAAAEGKLVYIELKTSPPKHLKTSEVGAFLQRVRALRPDVTLFVVDTALRLADKVLPLFSDVAGEPRRVAGDLWALTPHLYLVNAKPDVIANVGRAIAEGLRALAPSPP
jgi:hypothetical protein